MRRFNTYGSILVLSLVAAINFAPFALYAQPTSSGQNFVTLVPQLPLLGNQTSVPELLNALFGITIAIAAMLAVIMFVIGGFQYMASEAIGSKGDAASRMRSAVLGLLLVLISVLILNTINPSITMLNIFRSVPAEDMPPDAKVSGGTQINKFTACAAPDTPDTCCAAIADSLTLLNAEWTSPNQNEAKCTFER
jgi:hypothetical protein